MRRSFTGLACLASSPVADQAGAGRFETFLKSLCIKFIAITGVRSILIFGRGGDGGVGAALKL